MHPNILNLMLNITRIDPIALIALIAHTAPIAHTIRTVHITPITQAPIKIKEKQWK